MTSTGLRLLVVAIIGLAGCKQPTVGDSQVQSTPANANAARSAATGAPTDSRMVAWSCDVPCADGNTKDAKGNDTRLGMVQINLCGTQVGDPQTFVHGTEACKERFPNVPGAKAVYLADFFVLKCSMSGSSCQAPGPVSMLYQCIVQCGNESGTRNYATCARSEEEAVKTQATACGDMPSRNPLNDVGGEICIASGTVCGG